MGIGKLGVGKMGIGERVGETGVGKMGVGKREHTIRIYMTKVIKPFVAVFLMAIMY